VSQPTKGEQDIVTVSTGNDEFGVAQVPRPSRHHLSP
jgi:hypothetical protein